MGYDEDDSGSRNFGFDPRSRQPSVKIGDEIKIKIEGIGKSGDPYGKQNGFIIFIKGVGTPIPEGTAKIVKITKVSDTYALSQLVGDGNAN
jgi:predicted RNA-binding protein with TRAM domain